MYSLLGHEMAELKRPFICVAVWLGIMLPVLGVKSLSSYAIAYLERLLL